MSSTGSGAGGYLARTPRCSSSPMASTGKVGRGLEAQRGGCGRRAGALYGSTHFYAMMATVRCAGRASPETACQRNARLPQSQQPGEPRAISGKEDVGCNGAPARFAPPSSSKRCNTASPIGTLQSYTMKFGKMPTGEAEGAILAHSLQTRAGIIKKGRPLNSTDIEKLKPLGSPRSWRRALAKATSVRTMRLPSSRARLQVVQCGSGTISGRCNIYAELAGIAMLEGRHARCHQPARRSAHCRHRATVRAGGSGSDAGHRQGDPVRVAQATVSNAVALAKGGLVSVAPFTKKRAGLILTKLSNTRRAYSTSARE